MTEIDYASASIKVRDDITEAHWRAWQRIANPGTWWTGKERVILLNLYRLGRISPVEPDDGIST